MLCLCNNVKEDLYAKLLPWGRWRNFFSTSNLGSFSKKLIASCKDSPSKAEAVIVPALHLIQKENHPLENTDSWNGHTLKRLSDMAHSVLSFKVTVVVHPILSWFGMAGRKLIISTYSCKMASQQNNYVSHPFTDHAILRHNCCPTVHQCYIMWMWYPYDQSSRELTTPDFKELRYELYLSGCFENELHYLRAVLYCQWHHQFFQWGLFKPEE